MSIAKTGGTFLDSEVMQILEKVAIKRGLITPEPMEKTASAPKPLKATSDVHTDLISLVDSLRERGYEHEASALEDKIYVYKMAKDQYKKLCDEELVDSAHPEGDAEVAPSKEDYGKVETITSAQKKILDKVRKMPTGKLASMAAQMSAILKTAEDVDIDQVKAVLKDTVYQILQTEEVDNVVWGPDLDEWYATDNGEAEHIATMARAPVHDFILKKKEDFGVDPAELLDLIKLQALKYYTQKGPWGDLVENDVIDFKALLSAMFGGKIPLLSLTTAIKEKAKKKEEGAGSGKPARTHGVSADGLKKILRQMRILITDPDTDEDNRSVAEGAEKYLTNLINAVEQSKGLIRLSAVLQKLMPKIDFEGKSIYAIQGVLNRDAQKMQQWLDIIKKKSSRHDVLKKLSQWEPPKSDKKTDDKKPSQQADYLGIKIQQELKVLADAYEKRGGKADYTSQMRDTGAPGYGSQVAEALSYAEKVRQETGAKDLPVIEQQRSAATLANLQKLRAHIESGKGQLGQASSVIGEYIKESGEKIPVAKSDILSAWHFYNWAVENGELPYEDYNGEAAVNLQAFTKVITDVKNNALVQVQNAKDREEKRAKLYFVKAMNHVGTSYYRAAVAAGALKQGPDGKQPETMRVSDLKTTGAPRSSGVGGMGQPGQGGAGPFGMIAVNEAGQLASPVQVQFIDMNSPGSIGAGFPAKDFPPITRYLDLGNSYWWGTDMPETDVLDFYNWETADAQSIAGSMFTSANSWPQHIRNAVGQRLQENAQLIAKNPGIANQLYDEATKMAFYDFLRRLKAKISDVRAKYTDSIENPQVRQKLVPRSNKDAQAWIRTLNAKMDQLQRGGRTRRRY
jgi:hypothetical protein